MTHSFGLCARGNVLATGTEPGCYWLASVLMTLEPSHTPTHGEGKSWAGYTLNGETG